MGNSDLLRLAVVTEIYLSHYIELKQEREATAC